MIDSASLFDTFPPEWLVSATAASGGVDSEGDPIAPGSSTPFRAAFSPDGSTEAERSSETVTGGTLYAPLDEVPPAISSEWTVRLLDGPRPGRYAVVGDVIVWPLGYQIRLRKEADS